MSYERPLETGAIAYLNGNSDHTIAFRADIDALPIFENDVDYRSQTDNVMHACGHDGHTTALMLFVKRCKEMFDKERFHTTLYSSSNLPKKLVAERIV